MAELLARRNQEQALEARVRRALPPSLATFVAVANGRSSELALSTTSGAAAALLRQRIPDLLRTLAAEGWEFTGIRVRVQARSISPTGIISSKKQIDAPAAAHLRATAEALGESSLAAALRRLARRAAFAGSGQQDHPAQGQKHEDEEQ
jgi:hypothetical protein